MRRTRLSALFAIPVLSASLLLGATPALAAGTLDQSQPDASGRLGVFDSRPTGQTFTAGLTGRLDQVDLYPRQDMSGSTVQIGPTSAGLPTDTVLASAPFSSSATLAWVSIGFASPAPVTTGTQYAIVVVPASTSDWGSSPDSTSPYADGAAVIIQFGGTTWTAISVDLGFRTYVDTTYGFAWKSPTKGKGHGVNKPQAGTTVPVTFTLDEAISKTKVFAAGWPKVRRVDCTTKQAIEGTQWMTRPFGAKGLSRSGNEYTYAWQVRPEWGNGPLACREFRIKLTDGTTHSALFRFQPAD